MIDLNKNYDLSSNSTFKKWLLIIAGYFLVFLGILGLFLPVMPSTIFFILAAACFLRSSKKNYDRLLNNRIIGAYIRNYIEQRGMTAYSKFISITFLWVGLIVSSFFVVLWVKFLLLAVGIGVTIHIKMLREVKKEEPDSVLAAEYTEVE